MLCFKYHFRRSFFKDVGCCFIDLKFIIGEKDCNTNWCRNKLWKRAINFSRSHPFQIYLLLVKKKYLILIKKLCCRHFCLSSQCRENKKKHLPFAWQETWSLSEQIERNVAFFFCIGIQTKRRKLNGYEMVTVISAFLRSVESCSIYACEFEFVSHFGYIFAICMSNAAHSSWKVKKNCSMGNAKKNFDKIYCKIQLTVDGIDGNGKCHMRCEG